MAKPSPAEPHQPSDSRISEHEPLNKFSKPSELCSHQRLIRVKSEQKKDESPCLKAKASQIQDSHRAGSSSSDGLTAPKMLGINGSRDEYGLNLDTGWIMINARSWRDCPERKNQSHKNQIGGTGAHGVVHTLRGEETDQDPNNIKDEIKA
ncbi:hypothetical protein Tco_1010064 [Tanacetum coccineum]